MNRFLLGNRVCYIHRLFLLNLILIGFIIGVVLIFSYFYPPTLYDTSIFLPNLPLHISPKPLEESIFQVCCILVPLNSLMYVIINKIPQHKLNIFWTCIVPLVIGEVLFYCLLDSEWTLWLFKGVTEYTSIFNKDKFIKMDLILLMFMVLSSILNCFLLKINIAKSRYRDSIKLLNWGCFIVLSLLTLFAWRIYSIESIVNQDNKYAEHLDAVLYTLSQVVKGKVILADLPSQYGLFPEIIAPIFKIIGLSVLKFSLLMAVLQIISLTSLFYVLTKLIKNHLISFIAGCSLILLTFENIMYLSDTPDVYYQYWPIRFFWPALSVFMFFKFCKNKSILKSGLISFVSAIATIWNLDTGIFIFISYAAYLALRYLFLKISAKSLSIMPGHWKDNDFLQAFILHVVIFVLTISVFFIILSSLSVHSLNYELLYKYQRIFYSLGFGMIDLPTMPDPWMIVVSVYIYGLITSTYSLKANPNLKSELMFYLSILGVGLFTYYEGRSHPLNLFSVMWPAIIISAMFAENSIRLIRLKLINPVNLIFPMVILSIFLICTSILLINIPRYSNDLVTNLKDRNIYSSSLTRSELNFIKTNTKPNSECLLWIKNQASYYAEANLLSPIPGPGLVETVLVEDVNEIEKQIKLLRPGCIILGAGSSKYNPGFNYRSLFHKYVVVRKNKKGSILLLKPKQ